MEPDVLASLLRLSPEGPQSLVQQIYQSLRAAALAGHLPEGSFLPSSRSAAARLGLGRNTIVAAYELLAAEGVIETHAGRRPRIAPKLQGSKPPAGAKLQLSQRAAQLLPAPERAGRMSPGSPDPSLFPTALWGRALRHAARHRQDGAEGYAHFCGLPELRQVLAEHLSRHRGLVVAAEDILVTSGTQSSLMICAHAFADPGDVALVESPGYRWAQESFAASGLQCRPLGLDGEGALADQAAFAGARLAYVTPSTQYPSGMRMSMARRLALIDCAKASGTVLIEDDYDSEFVWRGRGIAALGALASGEGVITIGSAAKSLLPGLRIGWICAPKGAAPHMAQIQRRLGVAANVHAQAALADVLASGEYRSHIRRISKEYFARMQALRQALQAELGGGIAMSNPDGGLQLVLHLPKGAAERDLAQALNAAGYGVAALGDYALGPCASGLVIGFGNMALKEAAQFARKLAELLRNR